MTYERCKKDLTNKKLWEYRQDVNTSYGGQKFFGINAPLYFQIEMDLRKKSYTGGH